MASGHFERVNQFEPVNAPGHGLTCGVWVERVVPVRSSGLNSVSTLVVFSVRVYTATLSDPPDAIDPNMVAAVDALGSAYSGDFTLGDLVRNVDIFGAHGQSLDARAGYVEQDGVLYRVMTITLPVIVNDLWTEAP
jgi:hypothetical protein